MNKFIYKVAAVQAAPVYHDLKGTVEKTVMLIKEAAINGAALIAFPETWIPGYPYWAWLDSPAWGMQFVQAYHENSLVMGSEECEVIQEAARANNIYVSLGYSERDGGSLYMGQNLIGPDGKVIFTRRKLKPTFVERIIFGEGDGSDFKVAKTDIGNIGALCCWEHLQPLNRYAMFGYHEQVHIAAWPGFSLYEGMAYALGPEVNNAASMMYAVEGQCFVLAPCCIVSKEILDMLVADDPQKAAMLKEGGGAARIYGPDGQMLCEPLAPDEEGLLYADIDLGLISLAKAAADPVGHYSRPDVTRLVLDTRPQRPIELIQDDVSNIDNSDETVENDVP